ncbi:hypothetical protein FFF34_018520 [Inquilinus sp. KBS0705]|nr:hypothetical protein FFF34_018520 [Inquilinus sp. KBS0705]
MFEKLFLLVKNNAGLAVINNPAINESSRDAVINDATSSIIEVLKNQVESGKLKDMVKYFQFSGVYDNPLITSAVNRFAGKLNMFYSMDMDTANVTANQLIRPVMQELIRQSKEDQNKEFGLSALLAKLSSNVADMGHLLSQLRIA